MIDCLDCVHLLIKSNGSLYCGKKDYIANSFRCHKKLSYEDLKYKVYLKKKESEKNENRTAEISYRR